MKKIAKYLLLVSSLGLLSSCILAPEKKTSTEPNPTTSSQPSSTTTTSTKEIPSSCEFYTYGAYLPFDNYGVHISDEASGYQYRDALMTAINDQVSVKVIDSLSTSNCTILTDNGEADKDHFYLTIGTGSAGGYFQFNFVKKITKIKISVKPYYKSGYSVDTGATVYLDNDKHEIPNDGTNQPQASQTYEKEFATAKQSVRLHNDGEKQRFFLESVEVTFE